MFTVPNVNGYVDSVCGDVFDQMVFHEGVDFSVAEEVAYDVVHEFVCGFLGNF